MTGEHSPVDALLPSIVAEYALTQDVSDLDPDMVSYRECVSSYTLSSIFDVFGSQPKDLPGRDGTTSTGWSTQTLLTRVPKQKPMQGPLSTIQTTKL